MTAKLRVGTRGSELALRQTQEIIERMQAHQPGLEFEVVEITTHGDRFREMPIAAMAGEIDRGIFNTGLEEAILSGDVDFATCSFKDVESQLPQGLTACSVGPREDPRDVLVSRHQTDLAGLPEGAELATSSPRRTSQLRAYRPDFRFRSLRGNITTRVASAAEKFDGIILAGAGLKRLGLAGRASQWIGHEILLPAAAQAALGCEFATGREDVAALVRAIQDADTELCVQAEKRLLVTLSGGCFAPIGVLASVANDRMTLACRIVNLEGTRTIEDDIEGSKQAEEALVEQLARRIIAAGGREIIAETRARLQEEGA
ncbi:MAG: hydroxymethylbilane synthase [SAR324 cluster bacterium]|nr:hydroxymethylbilane synthase [SAR324 cluster bacterium]